MSRGWCPLTATGSWMSLSSLQPTVALCHCHIGTAQSTAWLLPQVCSQTFLHLCQWDQLGASHFSNSISFFTLASSLWVQPEGVIFQSQISILTPGSKHSPLSLFPHPTPLQWVLQQPQPSCLPLGGMRRNRKYTQHSPSKRRVIS